MHILGLGGTLRAHFRLLKPGLLCSGLIMGLETCLTFSILLIQIFPELYYHEYPLDNQIWLGHLFHRCREEQPPSNHQISTLSYLTYAVNPLRGQIIPGDS